MNIASLIDHTNLKPEATAADVDRLIAEAKQYGFASVCVNGCYAAKVAAALEGGGDGPARGVRTCAVVGFPLGAAKPMMKAIEATSACKDGADEIDFVAHLPHLLAYDVDAATDEFLEITQAARSVRPDVVVKVIIESALLMKEASAGEAEKRIEAACIAAQRSGCDFVKTSTGFHPAGGASVEAVRLMKKYATAGGRALKVKASGGIRTLEDTMRMIEAGADRLGCSSSVAIVRAANN